MMKREKLSERLAGKQVIKQQQKIRTARKRERHGREMVSCDDGVIISEGMTCQYYKDQKYGQLPEFLEAFHIQLKSTTGKIFC